MSDILIKNAYIVTLDERSKVIPDGFVEIEDGLIADIGGSSETRLKTKSASEVLQAKGMLVMPGLISGHTHATLSLLRGFAEGLGLDELAANRLWPFEKALKPEDSYAGARLACLEMIRFGTTAFADMHFNMGAVAKAVADMGLRASLCVAMMDRLNVFNGPEEALRENEDLVRTWHRKADGRIACMFGPCTIRLASEDLFVKARRLADEHGVGLHMHLSEVREDVEYSLAKFRKRPVEYLKDIGVLKEDVVAAHCVHLNDAEMDILKTTGVSMIHCPSSNLKTGAGVARVSEMLAKGINVGLGADAASNNDALDMFREMRLAALIQAGLIHSAKEMKRFNADAAIRAATINNAKALGLGGEVGSLEVGKRADLIVVDMRKAHLRPLIQRPVDNYVKNLVYAADGSDVYATIVDGRILMKDGKLLNADEDEIIEEAEKALFRVLERANLSFE